MPEPFPRWSLHETPNPAEKTFSVLIGNSEIADSMAEFDAYVEGSLFNEFPLIPDQDLAADTRFGLYRFNSCEAEGPSDMRYFFGKNKTPEEAKKPFRSTWTKFGNHRWCPILKGLAFVEDTTFPQSTNVISNGVAGIATAPRNYVREIFIQEVNEGSRFLLDEFLSPVPFVIGRYPVPQPGRISYQINGISGAFEECLHDDIEVPNTNSTTVTLFGSTEGTGDKKVPGQFFPRTNFRRRRPYVLAVDQELRDGVWYMQRLRVFPPRQPRTTVQ